MALMKHGLEAGVDFSNRFPPTKQWRWEDGTVNSPNVFYARFRAQAHFSKSPEKQIGLPEKGG
jgi:hypothetical protein